MSIDRIPPAGVRQAAESLLASLAPAEGGHVAALVDHCLAPDVALLAGWPGGRPPVRNLLAHLSGADERFSPLLIGLPEVPDERIELAAHLVRKCNGLPMLSFLASALPLEGLAAHLSVFTELALPPDGSRYLLRLGDTRVVPSLDGLLEPGQREALFGPICRWAYLDRSSAWCVLQGHGRPVSAAAPLVLSGGQLEAFIRAAMPDSFIATLLGTFPAFVGWAPSARYRLVCHWIAEADAAAGGRAEPGACLAHCMDCLAALE